MSMRLADFIRANLEPILQDWEDYAESLQHTALDRSGLRDHSKQMLLAIADDLERPQTEAQQAAKSKGRGPRAVRESWAGVHGGERQEAGFSVLETVSEFRALRASVVSHWTKSHPTISSELIEDLTRFHEAIDQAISESLNYYTKEKERDTRLFGAVLAASPDPIFVLDIKGELLFANKATCDLFELDRDAIIGQSIFDVGCSFGSDFLNNLEKVITDHSLYHGRFSCTNGADQENQFDYRLAPVMNTSEILEATVCVSRDVTEEARAQAKIWHHAHHDQLTGLPNRRLFLDRLKQEVKHARRGNLSLSVLYMDLDGFKEINASLGHDSGDKLLNAVADRLKNCVREEDTVARLGGDEFAVIVTGIDQREDAEIVAQSIIGALAVNFEIAQRSVSVSASIGIACYVEGVTTPVELLKSADQAMYSAKESESRVSHAS